MGWKSVRCISHTYEPVGDRTLLLVSQVVYTLEPLLYGNLVSRSRSGVDSFHLVDALGSTRQLARSTVSRVATCMGTV
jgi:hypothetical protein